MSKRKKIKIARLQVVMSVPEKEELRKVSFKERRTMSNVLLKSYKQVYGKE